jgi:hypothetical protein
MRNSNSTSTKNHDLPEDEVRAAGVVARIIAGQDATAEVLKALPDRWRKLATHLSKRPVENRESELNRWLDGDSARQVVGLIQDALAEARRRGLHEQEEGWGPPRLTGIDAIPAPPFPLDVLPEPLAKLIRNAAAVIQCPIDYLAAPALGLAGGAIGLSVVLRINTTWTERADLAVATVGPPGGRKSPPLKLLAAPLHEIDDELREKFRLAVQRYEQELEAWTEAKAAAKASAKKGDKADAKDPGPRPVAPPHEHLTLDDTTQEAVARIHHDNPRGMTLILDELAAWIASLNAYRSGKGADRQFWLKVRSGSLVKVTRKGTADPIVIAHPMVPVVGCLTPAGLPALCCGPDDGWTDRILFASPDPDLAPPRRYTEADVPQGDLDGWRQAIRRLYKRPMVEEVDKDTERITYRPYYVRFTKEGKDRWARFVDEHAAAMESPGFDRSLAGPWSKLEGYCARLALILCQLRWAYSSQKGDPKSHESTPDVDAEDVEGAARLVHYFGVHLRRVRAEIAGATEPLPEDARAVIAWARRHDRAFFSATEVNEQLGRFRGDPGRRDAALQSLTDHACIRPRPEPARSGPGRPPSPVFDLNPHLITRS